MANYLTWSAGYRSRLGLQCRHSRPTASLLPCQTSLERIRRRRLCSRGPYGDRGFESRFLQRRIWRKPAARVVDQRRVAARPGWKPTPFFTSEADRVFVPASFSPLFPGTERVRNPCPGRVRRTTAPRRRRGNLPRDGCDGNGIVGERRGQFASFMPCCTPGREPIRSPQACRCFSPALSGSALRPA